MEYIWSIFFGLAIGSFLNVCIHRIPRNMSLILPASSCPSCGNQISAYDNIPVISYLLLRGKCRHCKEPISARYPLIETLNALMYLAVIWRFGVGWHTPFILALCSAMIVITFIDLEFQIIPDAITLPGIAVGIIAGSFFMPDPFLRENALGFKNAAVGFALGGGLFYLIAVLSSMAFRQEAMGGGDIKMMAMLGPFLGWQSMLLTTFAGSLLGSIVGIAMVVFKGRERYAKIPFGPFLAAGAIISLFFGEDIIRLYGNIRHILN